jgi:hypothetical protein
MPPTLESELEYAFDANGRQRILGSGRDRLLKKEGWKAITDEDGDGEAWGHAETKDR